MRYLTFPSVLIFLCLSLFMVSIPHLLYAHEGSGSHTHPHPPLQHCMTCGALDVPGQHFCPEEEREKQEQEVKNSNNKAEIERLEDKVDDKDDKSFGDVVKDLTNDYILSPAGQAVKKIGEWLTGEEGSVKCGGGCGDWVSDDKEHWGTGTCQIGHVHWTCAPGAGEHHAGCHWVDEPENNPDSMYEGSKYSVTCESCGNTRWTNDLGTYMDWQNNSYCSTCREMYGH